MTTFATCHSTDISRAYSVPIFPKIKYNHVTYEFMNIYYCNQSLIHVTLGENRIEPESIPTVIKHQSI